MTVFYFALLVAIVGLVLVLLYPNSRRERVGLITFGCGLFFVLKYAVFAATHWHWS